MTFTPQTPTVNDGNIGKGLVAETDLYLQHLERMDKAMTFTPQTPTQPGVYLFKFDEDSPPDVIRLGHDNSGELRTSNGSGVIARTLGGLWCRLVPADEALMQTNWQESAREYARNLDFYHGIVIKCGEQFGKAAYTSDDGSVQDSVLALKVPQLVEQTLKEVARLKEEVEKAYKEGWCDGSTRTLTKKLIRTESQRDIDYGNSRAKKVGVGEVKWQCDLGNGEWDHDWVEKHDDAGEVDGFQGNHWSWLECRVCGAINGEVDLASLSCAHCGKPATCIGRYESMTKEEPACDDCCGHGNEDGYCSPISRAKRVVEGGE